MRLPWTSSSSSAESKEDSRSDNPPVSIPTPPSTKSPPPNDWTSYLNLTDWTHYTEPRNVVPSVLLFAALVGLRAVYKSYLRRIPSTNHIKPGYFRKRSLFGTVTSVGDADNFHLFHTPGGRLAGWGWLRGRKGLGRRGTKEERDWLRGRTIPIRIAGIDAPELSHFGRPAQPFSHEAHAFLTNYLLHKRVRAYIHRRDQYDRVVASVYIRKPPFYLGKDVGLEMLKRGLATVYEAKWGSEFGGKEREAVYREAEDRAKRSGTGLWKEHGFFDKLLGRAEVERESPREYKTRMAAEEEGKKAARAQTDAKSSEPAKKTAAKIEPTARTATLKKK